LPQNYPSMQKKEEEKIPPKLVLGAAIQLLIREAWLHCHASHTNCLLICSGCFTHPYNSITVIPFIE
ncbi:MAG: hypothetical protein Q6367_002700, partial [Candidatus Freyarchaeota archaeon]